MSASVHANKMAQSQSQSQTAWCDIIRSDPFSSEATKKHYITKLNSLAKIAVKDLPWCVKNADACMTNVREYLHSRESVKGVSTSTLRAYCMSMSALLKRVKRMEHTDPRKHQVLHDLGIAQEGELDQALRQWQCCSDDLRGCKQTKPDPTADKCLNWEDIVRKRAETESRCGYGSRAHLLLSLLTYHPPMKTSELASLKMIRSDKGAVKLSNKAANSAMLASKQNGVLLNNRDTAHLYVFSADDIPPLTGRLPRELARILYDSHYSHPREWVFVDASGEPYSGGTFNKVTSRILTDVFGGEHATVGDVRAAAERWVHALRQRNSTGNDTHKKKKKKDGDSEVKRFRYWMHARL